MRLKLSAYPVRVSGYAVPLTRYACNIMRQAAWLRERNYEFSLPPGFDPMLDYDVQAPGFFGAVLSAVEKDPEAAQNVSAVQAELDAAAPIVYSFLSRLDINRLKGQSEVQQVLPSRINVLLTAYGPGGSYNPQPDYARTPASIIVRPAKIRDGLTFVSNAVHETIHLAIEYGVVRDRQPPGHELIAHECKEKLVDQICRSDELRAVMGDYPLQETFWNQCSEDHRHLIPWHTPPKEWSL